jgi:hypothetical protein
MSGCTNRRRRSRGGAILLAGAIAAITGVAILAGLLAVVLSTLSGGDGGCADSGTAALGGSGGVALGPPGSGLRVGATEYGGPGDPSSGTTGARGDDLPLHPDTYAELGGLSWQTATAMGGLSYMTPLRITWGRASAIAYKRDFGLGGNPIDGLPRVIDLWWQLAGRLRIPYERGRWSGAVQVERPPNAGAGAVLGQVPADSPGVVQAPAGAEGPVSCAPGAASGVPLTAGERALLRSDGLAAAPQGAPEAVKQMIAAGNEIVDKPYVYGGGHDVPVSELAPAYDCSASVSHLLYGGSLLSEPFAETSGALEGFGLPGPGRWVTLYANADHVFMYVAGLRWDTHAAAGPGDGGGGIGWHPMVRGAAGFVARHPVGL